MSDFDHSGSGAVVTGGACGVGEAAFEFLAEFGGFDLTIPDLEAASGPDQVVVAKG